MTAILTCVLSDGLSAVEAACLEALEHGVCGGGDPQHPDQQPRSGAGFHPQALKLAHEPIADCVSYDGLRRTN